MTDDPWKSIDLPSSTNSIAAKRVDPAIKWGFFWGRSADDSCLFVLQHSAASSPKTRPPRMRGIDVAIITSPANAERVLMFTLHDSAQRDIFEELCRDIVDSTENCTSESDAVATALARTWRWHHLLRGGADGKLSLEERKGLVCELLLLESHFLTTLTPLDAVNAWRGPLSAPKDFESGRVCVEAKARRAASSPFVEISSASQLDSSGTDRFFLYVAELDQAPSSRLDAFSLTDVAVRVRTSIATTDEAAIDVFDGLLAASGFDMSDDYSDSRWIAGQHAFYEIAEGFPRIVPGMLSTAIANVKYSLALAACTPFLVDDEELKKALGATHVS